MVVWMNEEQTMTRLTDLREWLPTPKMGAILDKVPRELACVWGCEHRGIFLFLKQHNFRVESHTNPIPRLKVIVKFMRLAGKGADKGAAGSHDELCLQK